MDYKTPQPRTTNKSARIARNADVIVDKDTLADGQVLMYKSATCKWENDYETGTNDYGSFSMTFHSAMWDTTDHTVTCYYFQNGGNTQIQLPALLFDTNTLHLADFITSTTAIPAGYRPSSPIVYAKRGINMGVQVACTVVIGDNGIIVVYNGGMGNKFGGFTGTQSGIYPFSAMYIQNDTKTMPLLTIPALATPAVPAGSYTTALSFVRVNASLTGLEEFNLQGSLPAGNQFQLTSGTTDLIVSADCTINQNLSNLSTPSFVGTTLVTNASNPGGADTLWLKTADSLFYRGNTPIVIGPATGTTVNALALWNDTTGSSVKNFGIVAGVPVMNQFTFTAGTSVLTVSASCNLNQDVTTTSSPTFTAITAPTITCSNGTIQSISNLSIILDTDNDSTTDALHIYHHSNSASNSIFSVTENGIVKLGSASSGLPNCHLHFLASDTDTSPERSWYCGVPFHATLATFPYFGFSISDSSLLTPHLYIAWNTGNVGIGVIADPVSKLEVNGTITSTGLSMTQTVTKFDTDTTLAGDSDSNVPTQKAVKAYVDGLRTSGAHNTNWSGAVYANPQAGNLTYTKEGNHVCLHFPDLSVATTANPSILTSDTALPVAIRPSVATRTTIMVQNNGGYQLGKIQIATNGVMTINATVTGSNFSGTGANAGFVYQGIFYTM